MNRKVCSKVWLNGHLLSKSRTRIFSGFKSVWMMEHRLCIKSNDSNTWGLELYGKNAQYQIQIETRQSDTPKDLSTNSLDSRKIHASETKEVKYNGTWDHYRQLKKSEQTLNLWYTEADGSQGLQE